MGFFKRRQQNQDEIVMMPAADASGIVNELGEAVVNATQIEKPPGETLQALQVGLPFLAQRQLSDEAVLAGQAAARLGYFSRFVEFNRFQAAPRG